MNDDPEAKGDSASGPRTEFDKSMFRLLRDALPSTSIGDENRPARHLGPFLQGQTLQPRVPALAAGESLGRFRLESVLGSGGCGVVYRAMDTHLAREVAIKIPRPDRVHNIALWDVFAREARLAARLDHESIVPIFEAGVQDGVFAIVSAYQEGEPLSRWLAARYPTGTPPRVAAEIALRLADGLRHAHERGVLHRDLKPSNVLMIEAPDLPGGWLPRITDFGLGTFYDETEAATLSGFWQGSPPYMAPEQVLPNLGRVDARSDVYALGSILYEMLVGRPILPSSTLVDLSVRLSNGQTPVRPRKLRKNVPADLETICMHCLEQEPDRRYATASELYDELRRFLDGRSIKVRPDSPWERVRRWARRKPSHAVIAGLLGAAIATTVGLVVHHARDIAGKNTELARSNHRLRNAVEQRDGSYAALKSTLDRLLISERTAQRTAFAADLRLAERELAAGRVESAQDLLRRYEPVDGQEDLRGEFSYRYLLGQATRTYSALPLKDFRWWRGSVPLVPIFKDLDHRTQQIIWGSMIGLNIDTEGLRSGLGPASVILTGRRCIGFDDRDDHGILGSNLSGFDGSTRTPVGVPNRRHLLSPDGRVLVFLGGTSLVAENAPALIRHPDVTIPSGGPRDVAGTRVIELPFDTQAVKFSSDGLTVACLAKSASGAIPMFYDLATERRVSFPQHRTMTEIAHPVDATRPPVTSQIVLSRDGRLAAVSGAAPRLRVFETTTGRTLWELPTESFDDPPSLVTSLALATDADVLAVGDTAGRVRCWTATTGRALGQFPERLGHVVTVGFHPDARTVAIILYDEDIIRLWNYAQRPQLPEAIDHGKEVWALTFANSGAVLVSAGDDHRGVAWNPATGEKLGSYEGSTLQSVAATDPATGRIVLGGFDGVISLHRPSFDGPALATCDLLRGTRIRAIATTGGGPAHIVAGGNRGRILIATTSANGEALDGRLVDTPHHNVYGLAFSPDGKTLAMGSHGSSGSHDRTVTLWDMPDFHRRAKLVARSAVTSLTFSPDGRTLVSGDMEGGLQFWDMATLSLLTTRARVSEKGGVWALAFSPDGETLAIGCDDNLVRLWDPKLAIERVALAGHEAKVHALAFAPDGRTLASGDFLGKIRLWRVGP